MTEDLSHVCRKFLEIDFPDLRYFTITGLLAGIGGILVILPMKFLPEISKIDRLIGLYFSLITLIWQWVIGWVMISQEKREVA